MGEHARKKNSDTHKQPPISSRNLKKEVQPPAGELVGQLETRLTWQREEQERIARVEELKAQVRDGTYKVDSKALAQKMLKSPDALKLLGLGKQDLFAPKEKE